MPQIPTYDNFRAQDTPGTPGQFSAPSTPGAGQIAARQAQDLGGAVAEVGRSAQQIALSMQEQVNQVRVNDAVNQARRAVHELTYAPEGGFLSLKGLDALERPQGQSLGDEYGRKLQERLDGIRESLSDGVQRHQFQANAQDLLTGFMGQVDAHMLGEFRTHAVGVSDGTIALASDDARRHWMRPDTISRALGAAKAAVVEKGRVLGWAAAQTDAMLLATTSKVHTDAVLAAMDAGNGAYAQGYLERNRAEMAADDILRVQGHVNQMAWVQMGQQAAQQATAQVLPEVVPAPMDIITRITMASESGGRRFDAKGGILTSSAGAKGEMQVLDSTAIDPGFGIRPARRLADGSIDPDDRARVGREYLPALMRKYGDPAKMWAAYNAGPGRLDDALAQANSPDLAKRGRRGDWLAHMPAETQAYVKKNMAALQAGQVAVARPTELDFVNRAVALLPKGAPPQAVQVAREQASRQFGLMSKTLDTLGDNAIASAQRWFATKPGASFEQLPADVKQAIVQFAPGKLDELRRYSEALAKPTEVRTNLPLYNELTSNPQKLASASDVEFEGMRFLLSETDFKHFAKLRADLRTGTPDTSAGGLNRAAINSAIDLRLPDLGINPNPPARKIEELARVGAIRRFVNDSVADAQRGLGRQLTADEVNRHIDGLFSNSTTFRSTLFGVPVGGSSSSRMLALQAGDLPGKTVNELRAALLRAGNKNPTDNEIMTLYWKIKNNGQQ